MVDLILAKRQGSEHNRDEIDFIVSGVVNESIKDYQIAAWLMAVCWQGMTFQETAHLTDAFAQSGQVMDLSSLGPVVGDKHSTGGVGDKTTLVFAPMMAAAGIPMAKLSGRGLGHTGGTLDKLEAIPGFDCNLTIDQFIRQVKEVGAAIGGQTAELAPADGKIYALRDVTATVESVPLIAASVMSKKVAAGANLIILDVKCGAGAFMDTRQKASALASTLAAVGEKLGRPVSAVVTDMEQPLGFAVGHTLEVIEAIDTLKGNGPADLVELCMALGSLALTKAGRASSETEGRKRLESVIESGEALDKFRKIIKAQGGNADVIEKPSLMPRARFQSELMVPGSGSKWIKHIDGRKVAHACKLMGAGRDRKEDPVNLAVGVVLKAKVGGRIQGGDCVCVIHADEKHHLDKASETLCQAITYSDNFVAVPPVVLESF